MFFALRHSATRRLVTTTTSQRALLSSTPATTTTPPPPRSVKDMLIRLTVVDPSGARKQINGLIGKTLYETFEMQGIEIGPMSTCGKPETPRSETWMEPTFGEGPTSGYDHVVLTGKGTDKIPRMTYAEKEQLEDYWDWDEIFDGSRLASVVTLTKDMDGMVVYVPDRIVDDVP